MVHQHNVGQELLQPTAREIRHLLVECDTHITTGCDWQDQVPNQKSVPWYAWQEVEVADTEYESEIIYYRWQKHNNANKIHCFFSYVHVTAHHNKFLYNKTNQTHQFPKFTPAWNSTCFGQFLCPSSGVYSLSTRHWYMSYRFEDSFRAGQWWNSILALLKSCLQTCDIYQCRVHSEQTPDDGQRNCPKHVKFHAGVNLGNWCIWFYYKEKNTLLFLLMSRITLLVQDSVFEYSTFLFANRQGHGWGSVIGQLVLDVWRNILPSKWRSPLRHWHSITSRKT